MVCAYLLTSKFDLEAQAKLRERGKLGVRVQDAPPVETSRLRSLQHQITAGRLLWAALGLATLVVTVTHLHELRQILATLRHAEAPYLIGAAAFQAAFLLNLALYHHSVFAATGLRAPLHRFVLLATAAYFVNLVSKTGGLGGVALYLNEGSRRGFPGGRVITAYMVNIVLGHLAFLATLALALVLLYVRGSLNTEEVVASGVIFAVLVVIFVLLLLAVSSRARLERLYRWLARLGNRAVGLLGRGPIAVEEGAAESAGELHDAVEHVRGHLFSYGRPFVHAVLVEVLSIGVLFMVAQALDANITLATAVAAYALSVLFAMIAITPAGLGFVEASLAVLFVSFGVPATRSVAVSLGYRFFEFWVPLLLGAAALRALGKAESA